MARGPNELNLDEIGGLLREIQTEGPIWRFDGSEIALWLMRIRDLIRRSYPVEEQAQRLTELDNVSDYRRTIPVRSPGKPDRSNGVAQQEFQQNLPRLKAYSQALLSDLTASSSSPQRRRSVELIPILRIFVVHDGATSARRKLEEFIRALGALPVTAEDEPSKGRSISEKVDAVIGTCQDAVVLATKPRGSRQNGETLARANVINELPRVRSALGPRWMVALEPGIKLPSNESNIIFEKCSSQSMDQIFLALVRELRGHNILILQPNPIDSERK